MTLGFHSERIGAVHQHMPTPLAHSHDEQLDLEIGGRFPLSENLQYPLLGILILHRRSLWTFEPADHVFHWYSPLFSGCHQKRSRLNGLTTQYRKSAVIHRGRAEPLEILGAGRGK